MTITESPSTPTTSHVPQDSTAEEAAAKSRKPRLPRGSLRVFRQGLGALAAFSLLLGMFLTFGTALTHDRAQKELQSEFRSQAAVLSLPPQFETNPDGTTGSSKPIRIGSPVAWMKIPKLGVSEVVVEGSKSSQTLRGPGHIRSTPLPGQYGNSVVVCRRIAGGAPCADLDRLKSGDEIRFTTAFGEIKYHVFAAGVTPANRAEIFNTLTSGEGADAQNINTVTLITSDPAILATDRFIVQARLAGNAENFTPSRFQVDAQELGLKGESSGWLLLLFALQFLLVVAVGAVWLAKTWNPRTTWIVATPLLLCAVWLTCEQFIRVIPASV